MSLREAREFWREACLWQDSATPRIMVNVVAFGLFAMLVVIVDAPLEAYWKIKLALPVSPHEIAGAVLGLLLVLRTNAGYDRWWEARKLWGGIVNQSRNLAIGVAAFGRSDRAWCETTLRWIASFSHTCRQSLRNLRDLEDVARLVTPEAAASVASAAHMPSDVAVRISRLLKDALEAGRLTGFEFQQLDRERTALIDHIGACERILKTPLPLVSSIKIRHFIVLFLGSLPFGLLNRIEAGWLIPLITLLVAWAVLLVDEIGEELQFPFDLDGISPLPLEDICRTIETSVLGVMPRDQSPADPR